MKKALIAALGVIVLAGASAFATETRTTVMGENNMIMVDDANIGLFPGRVNNYPNLALAEFGNNNGDGLYNFGVTWQFNEKRPWVLGMFVSTYPTYYPNADMGWFYDWNLPRFPDYGYYGQYPGTNSSLYNGYSPRRMQLVYGRKLGGQNFGFAFESVRSSWEVKGDSLAEYNPYYYPGDTLHYNENPKESFAQYKFSFGLTEATSGKWDVALSALFGSWTNKDPWGQKISEPSGYSDFSLAGRYFWVRNPKVTLVPHARIEMNKRGAKYLDVLRYYDSLDFNYWDTVGDSSATAYFTDFTNDDAKTEYTRSSFDFGIGMNYTPAPKMLAVADFGVSLESVKAKYSRGADLTNMIALRGAMDDYGETWYPDEYYYSSRDDVFGDGYGDAYQYLVGEEKSTYTVFPYLRLGFEGEVFSWMDVRLGGTTTLWSNKEKFTSDFYVSQTWNTVETQTYFGLGFNWGKLYLDTQTDPRMLLRGFNFINGNNTSSDSYRDMNFRVSLLYEMF